MALETEQARSILDAQPFSSLIGATLTRFEDGVAELSVAFRPELTQQFGFAHGGVLLYLADNAVTFAAGSVLGPSLLTASLAISYLRPARGDLRAIATVVGRTRRQAVVRCEVYAGDTLVASAQGTASAVEPASVSQ
jgi:uncharacterized protein (TIGR00369 family)